MRVELLLCLRGERLDLRVSANLLFRNASLTPQVWRGHQWRYILIDTLLTSGIEFIWVPGWPFGLDHAICSGSADGWPCNHNRGPKTTKTVVWQQLLGKLKTKPILDKTVPRTAVRFRMLFQKMGCAKRVTTCAHTSS